MPEIAPNPDDRAGRVSGPRTGCSGGTCEACSESDRNAVWFLVASAIYRDGLTAIFTFGAVLAVSVYGLSAGDVILFGVAANVVAAIGAFIGGAIEDRVGPKAVIMTSLLAPDRHRRRCSCSPRARRCSGSSVCC